MSDTIRKIYKTYTYKERLHTIIQGPNNESVGNCSIVAKKTQFSGKV